jgi:splicing factor 3A subunit 2
MNVTPLATTTQRQQINRVTLKIGRPGYKVTKVRDATSQQNGLLFQIYYPDLGPNAKPRHRFMSSYEQRVEPPSKYHQYILFAGDPYETIAFKIQSMEIDKEQGISFIYKRQILVVLGSGF